MPNIGQQNGPGGMGRRMIYRTTSRISKIKMDEINMVEMEFWPQRDQKLRASLAVSTECMV